MCCILWNSGSSASVTVHVVFNQFSPLRDHSLGVLSFALCVMSLEECPVASVTARAVPHSHHCGWYRVNISFTLCVNRMFSSCGMGCGVGPLTTCGVHNGRRQLHLHVFGRSVVPVSDDSGVHRNPSKMGHEIWFQPYISML